MPTKKRVTKRAPRNHMGGGFWSDAWGLLKEAHKIVKDNKLISKGMKMLPVTAPYAQYAESLGYGKKKGGARLGVTGTVRYA